MRLEIFGISLKSQISGNQIDKKGPRLVLVLGCRSGLRLASTWEGRDAVMVLLLGMEMGVLSP
jgi:hypothetical protein